MSESIESLNDEIDRLRSIIDNLEDEIASLEYDLWDQDDVINSKAKLDIDCPIISTDYHNNQITIKCLNEEQLSVAEAWIREALNE